MGCMNRTPTSILMTDIPNPVRELTPAEQAEWQVRLDAQRATDEAQRATWRAEAAAAGCTGEWECSCSFCEPSGPAFDPIPGVNGPSVDAPGPGGWKASSGRSEAPPTDKQVSYLNSLDPTAAERLQAEGRWNKRQVSKEIDRIKNAPVDNGVDPSYTEGMNNTTTTQGPAVTEPQARFLTSLLTEKAHTYEGSPADAIEALNTLPNPRKAASALIDTLKDLPRKAATTAPKAPTTEVPQGHYAVPSLTGNNDLDFVRVDRPTEGRWAGYVFVKRVIGGHEDQRVRGAEAAKLLAAIEAEGAEAASIAYGRAIGRCGRCNRHLTDEASRAAGIGPDCAQKGW